MSLPAPQLPARIPHSPNLLASFERAEQAARQQGHRHVTNEHLLLALVDDPEVAPVLVASRIEPERLRTEVMVFLGSLPDRLLPGEQATPQPHPDLVRMLEYASAAATQSRRPSVTGAIVLAAIVGDGKTQAAHLLRAQGLSFEVAIQALRSMTAPAATAPPHAAPVAAQPRQVSQALPPAQSGVSQQPVSPPARPGPSPAAPAPSQVTPPRQPAPQPAVPHPPQAPIAQTPVLHTPSTPPPVAAPAPRPVAPEQPRPDHREYLPQASETRLPPARPSPVERPPSAPPDAPMREPIAEQRPAPVAESAPEPEPEMQQREFEIPPPQRPTAPTAERDYSAEPSPRPGRSPVRAQARPQAELQQAGDVPGQSVDPGTAPTPRARAPQPPTDDVDAILASIRAQRSALQNAPRPEPPPSQLGGQPDGPPRHRPDLQAPPSREPSHASRPSAGPAPGAAPGHGPAHELSVQQGPEAQWRYEPRQRRGPDPAAAERPSREPLRDAVRRDPDGPALDGHGGDTTPGAATPYPPPEPQPAATPRARPARPTGEGPGSPPRSPPARRQSSTPKPAPTEAHTAPALQPGELVENVPRRMRAGVSEVVEVRIARDRIEGLDTGMRGRGRVQRHELFVTKAMAVRLRAPEGDFWIEPASPETQWIENSLGLLQDEFATWRWTITPKRRGTGKLVLIVSARTIDQEGLAAETALPDQKIDVKIRTNYGLTFRRVFSWLILVAIGGVVGKFGESLWPLAALYLRKWTGWP